MDRLRKIIRQKLEEMSLSGGSASFTPGTGMNYVPKGFKKANQKKLRKNSKSFDTKDLWK